MSKKTKRKKKSLRGVPNWMAKGNMSKVTQKDADNYRIRQLGTFGAASAVRRYDPITGKLIEVDTFQEQLAADILRADQSKPNKPKRKKRIRKTNASPTVEMKNAFYRTWGWRTLRIEVLNEQGKRCNCCGSTPEHLDMAGKRVRLQVDHIKPLSRFWHLRLTKSNLQVLCEECNQGKGGWDETDHRPEPDIEERPMTAIEMQLGERMGTLQ